MKSIKTKNWETLMISAPAGFVTYFLKMQHHLKTSFGKMNLETTQFKQISDTGFSCKVHLTGSDVHKLDKMKNSLFNQLPDKTPAQAKDFIKLRLKK